MSRFNVGQTRRHGGSPDHLPQSGTRPPDHSDVRWSPRQQRANWSSVSSAIRSLLRQKSLPFGIHPDLVRLRIYALLSRNRSGYRTWTISKGLWRNTYEPIDQP